MKNAGAKFCFCVLNELLVPAAVVTTICTDPIVASSGASTLICVGLMYSTYAGNPLIVTDTPCSDFGNCPFTISRRLAMHKYSATGSSRKSRSMSPRQSR